MALIIPYRNRYEQLSIFVRHMHPMLKKQNVDYRILVVEQVSLEKLSNGNVHLSEKSDLLWIRYQIYTYRPFVETVNVNGKGGSALNRFI